MMSQNDKKRADDRKKQIKSKGKIRKEKTEDTSMRMTGRR